MILLTDADRNPPRPRLALPSWIVEQVVSRMIEDAKMARRLMPVVLDGNGHWFYGESSPTGKAITVRLPKRYTP